MATIQRPIKLFNTRKYVDEVAADPDHLAPILASEVDGDIDGIYAAWNGGVDTVNIKPGVVTTGHLGDGVVTDPKIVSLSWGKLTGVPATFPIAVGSVGTVQLADQSVTNAKIADGNVTGNKIYNGSITNAKIADQAVTVGKIMPGSTVRNQNVLTIPANWTSGTGTWQTILQFSGFYVAGSRVTINFAASLYYYGNTNVWFRVLRDAVNFWQIILKYGTLGNPTPPWSLMDVGAVPGFRTYQIDVQCQTGVLITDPAAVNNGYVNIIDWA